MRKEIVKKFKKCRAGLLLPGFIILEACILGGCAQEMTPDKNGLQNSAEVAASNQETDETVFPKDEKAFGSLFEGQKPSGPTLLEIQDLGENQKAFSVELLHEVQQLVYAGNPGEIEQSFRSQSTSLSAEEFMKLCPDFSEQIQKLEDKEAREYFQMSGAVEKAFLNNLDEEGDGMLLVYGNTGSIYWYPVLLFEREYELGWRLRNVFYISGERDIFPFSYDGEQYMGRIEKGGMDIWKYVEESGREHLQQISIGSVQTGIRQAVCYVNEQWKNSTKLSEYVDSCLYSLLYCAGAAGETALFRGSEKTELTDGDWEVVRPLGNSTAKRMEYFKADIDNDGSEELLYRSIDISGEPEMTVSVVNIKENGTAQIAGLEGLGMDSPENSLLQQIWFEDFDGQTVTFRLFRLPWDNAYAVSICIIHAGEEAENLAVYAVEFELDALPGKGIDRKPALYTARSRTLTGENYEKAYEALSGGAYQYHKDRQFEKIGQWPKELPDTLLTMLADALSDKTNCDSYERISAACGPFEEKETELTKEELLVRLGDAAIDIGLADLTVYHAYCADYDGDGLEDVAVYADSGGTAGFTFFLIYRQMTDGSYEETDGCNMLRGYGALLKWEGEHYFIHEEHNYYSKEVTGALVLRINSSCALEQYALDCSDSDYHWYPLYCREEEPDQKEIDACLERMGKELIRYSAVNDDYKMFEGGEKSDITDWESREMREFMDSGELYRIDFDNDGQDEYISKYMWFPSSYHQNLELSTEYFMWENGHIRQLTVDFPVYAESGEALHLWLIQLWFEQIKETVYTFRLLLIPMTSDFILEVSRIEGDKLTVMQNYYILNDKKLTARFIPK